MPEQPEQSETQRARCRYDKSYDTIREARNCGDMGGVYTLPRKPTDICLRDGKLCSLAEPAEPSAAQVLAHERFKHNISKGYHKL